MAGCITIMGMLVSLHQVRKFYGKQDLFDRVDLQIREGEKIGLVGANGSGKSTLIRMILGEVSPDGGEIHRARSLRMGHLPQDVLSLRGGTVLDKVLEVASEMKAMEAEIRALEEALSSCGKEEEREEMAKRLAHLEERFRLLGGYELRPKAQKILMGLGFEERDFARPVETLSGGWAMRAAMARLLLVEPDLLLLDEPTNHLDLEALRWLEGYLTEVPSAVLVVSHDRTFLNKVVERIVEVEEGKLFSYRGGFDAYRQQKEKRLEQQWAAYRVQLEKIRQMERFIERNRARKDRARQVQSRIRALQKMERVEPPRSHRDLKFRFPPAPPSGRLVVHLERITFGYGEAPLYQEATLHLHRGDRVAILGPNGSGKSTLLRLLAGQLTPERGGRRLGHGVRVAYFAQHQMDLLHPEKTVLEELMDSSPQLHQGELRNLLGAFQFRGDAVFKKVRVLSGGERSRLLLCRILLEGGNLLLLDEPTNHLDIDSREVLEEALRKFDGTLCLVTHDRRLINRVANRILVMRPGGWELFPGTYEDYERIWRRRPQEETAEEEDLGRKAPKKDRIQRRLEAEWRNRFYRLRAPLEAEIARIEQDVEEVTARLDEIREQMAAPDLYASPERVLRIRMEHDRLKQQLEELTRRWEERSLELEELKERMERERPS
jgi:ATP-binding cassette subfamily F protein 3